MTAPVTAQGNTGVSDPRRDLSSDICARGVSPEDRDLVQNAGKP
ncbi:hypothetical protein [Thalassobius sp. I31.1]|nr:hypothetical protein [Thalassobius sp. I31.1]